MYCNFRGSQDLSSVKWSKDCKLTLTYIYKTITKFKLIKTHILFDKGVQERFPTETVKNKGSLFKVLSSGYLKFHSPRVSYSK